MKKIGILGISNRPVSLLKLLLKNKHVEFAGVYDSNMEQAQILAKKLDTSASSNPFGIISNSDILLIPKTDDTSYNLIVESILNSKNVVVEKPLNLTIQEIEELNKLAQEAEVSVVPYLPFRFSNCVLSSKSYIFNPGLVTISYNCLPELSDNHSAKLELLLNLIDLAANIIKAHVKKVSANAVAVLPHNLTSFCIRLDFDNGCTANINIDMLSGNESLQLTVYQNKQITSIDLSRNYSVIKSYNKENALEYDIIKPLISKNENPYFEIINYINLFSEFKTSISLLDSFKNSLHTLRKVEERIFQR